MILKRHCLIFLGSVSGYLHRLLFSLMQAAMRDKMQDKQKKWEDWEKQVEEEERLRKGQPPSSVSCFQLVLLVSPSRFGLLVFNSTLIINITISRDRSVPGSRRRTQMSQRSNINAHIRTLRLLAQQKNRSLMTSNVDCKSECDKGSEVPTGGCPQNMLML